MTSDNSKAVAASFRDPSGTVFKKNNQYFRQINLIYKKDYDFLQSSGLFAELVGKKYLVDHKEIDNKNSGPKSYKIIKPEQISFISYPYEWCFSQLKDAALLTLEIQSTAMKFGMSLKDASAYNIQFVNSKPILIDTLSFEKYRESKPWIAYRQFCQHFLAPLALMTCVDLRFGTLSQIYLDGLPLDLTAKLLPVKARFSLGLGSHIFLHAKSQLSHAADGERIAKVKIGKNQLLGIIDSLKSTVGGLKLPKQLTTWGDYYNKTNYSSAGLKTKEEIIDSWITKIQPETLWDAGANDSHFGRLGSKKKIQTVASDIDPIAVEHAYLRAKSDADEFLLPLILDLTNPSPAIGWENRERDSFWVRAKFDLTLCLAFIHHLAITNNLPLNKIAELFANQTKYLIIEFVPKNDSNTKRLLANRQDIFPDYNQKMFELIFSQYFKIKKTSAIAGSKRTLYLMERKNR